MKSNGHHTTELMLWMLRSRDDKLCADAADEIEWLHELIKKLERRIHNQRRQNRETWETVEMRRKWLGSDVARRSYCNLLKRYQELRSRIADDRNLR